MKNVRQIHLRTKRIFPIESEVELRLIDSRITRGSMIKR